MRLRNHLYQDLYIPICKLFFEEHVEEILGFAADYQRDVSQVLCQIYSQLCCGFKQTLRSFGLADLIVSPKVTIDKPESAVPASAPKVYEIEMLKEMGFTTDQATKALQLSDNSFDAALELLLSKKVLADLDAKEQAQTLNVETLQLSYEAGQAEHNLQINELLTILGSTFGRVHEYFSLCPLSLQQ